MFIYIDVLKDQYFWLLYSFWVSFGVTSIAQVFCYTK